MSPLHGIGDFLRELLMRVPLEVVRGMFVAVFIVLLIWVLRLPREEVTNPDRTTQNLKPWAALALIVQLLIYSWL
jgi:hypothetical protein